MNRILLAGVGLLALSGLAMPGAGAIAADVPPGRLPPPARGPVFVPYFTWVGFYAGLNAGYGFGNSNWTATTGLSTGDFDVGGALVGGTLGYNYQLGSFIVGLETDLGWSGIKGDTATNCVVRCETELRWLGTTRARLGYAFDRFLPYITGGISYGNVEARQQGFGSINETRLGWNAGAGLEYAFMHNWSAKVEYLYVDLGELTCNAACSGTVPFDVSFTSSIVRGGLNYRF